MKLFKTHKKLAVSSLALVVTLMAGGVAYAYFSSTGGGTGTAKTGSVSALTISQIGAAYDSLNTDGTYNQDQCFSCAGSLTEFGNEINLATTGELSDVVVAFRNWDPATTTGNSATLNIYNTSNLSVPIATATNASFTIPAGGPWAPGDPNPPSVFNVTFDFSSLAVTLPSTVVYGIIYNDTSTQEASMNVALSSSATNLTVGQDTYPGNVWVLSTVADPLSTSGDANSCGGNVSTAGSFSPEYIWCGFNSNNPRAYGNPGGDGADIPAVEFNVVGGTVPALYPGDSAQTIGYAITNPGAGNEQVNTVTVAIGSSGGLIETTAGNTGSTVAGCYSSWYQLNYTPQTLNTTIPGNSTLIFGSTKQLAVAGDVVSIQMLSPPSVNQDACEGATVGLSFSSN